MIDVHYKTPEPAPALTGKGREIGRIQAKRSDRMDECRDVIALEARGLWWEDQSVVERK